MRNNANAIQGSIQLILMALGGTFGYKVIFGAFQTASINFEEKVFRFPHLPLEVSEKDKLRLFGYMWHELSHAKYTNPDSPKAVKPKAFAIFNRLEDVFIECKHNAVSDFAKMRMEGLTNILIEDGSLAASKPDESPASIFTNFCLNFGYAHVVDHKQCIPLADSDEKLFEKTFGLPLLIKVKALIRSCATAADSLENARTANHMLEILEEEAKDRKDKANQQQQQQQQQQNGEADQGQGQQQQQNGGESQSNQESQASGSNSSQSPTSEMKEQSQGQGGSGGEGASKDQEIADAIESLLNDKLLSESNDVRSTLDFNHLDAQNGKVFSYEPPNAPLLGQNADISKYKVLPSLALQVKRSFESKNKCRVRARVTGTRLHKKFPLAMAVGNPNVFRHKTETKAMNTHVSIAWDTSGSMDSHDRFTISQQAIVSMIDAFEKTRGLTSSVCEFSGRFRNHIKALKLEHHSLEQVKSNFITRADGGTPTEYGQYWCMEQCMASKAKRKIIIIITDGRPNSAEHLPTMNKLCAQAGVEVYALGLRCQAVTQYWKNSMNIHDISDLPNQISNVIKG
ncbi:hypothetical protein VA249_42270 (plasmid) [Vibrio alfacsensis]|uniref:VWA domain-containing protein n=1 Tax=Vibrio alfacsensis TaxID=1074311 RepID=UPI001BF04AFB|nr:VWA domain-containing protein [Vibrio alfacsensis]BBM67581.1 hypothetical protein VA249_42270 [Vibrio alfacsensis]